MAIDLRRDARRLRAVVTACATALLATLAVAGAQAFWPGWQRSSQPSGAPGLVQKTTCAAAVDRCETCHLGGRGTRGQQHSPLLAAHAKVGVGCSDCHGGSGRSLQVEAAHAFPGDTATDPLRKQPHIQASCARCHTPGDAAGMERLLRGEKAYVELGCGICHPLQGGGRGGWDFGPDLRALGRKSVRYLESSLITPEANFPESTMPSFSTLQDADPARFTDLVIFLESLQLPRAPSGECSLRAKSAGLAQLPCATCHAGARGKAAGRFEHRCVYLKERKGQLACGGCHGAGVPEAGKGEGTCPVEREHRGNCAGCHETPGGGLP